MRIVITGTPGTGKSTIAKNLARLLGLELIDLKRFIKKNMLMGKNHEVDVKKLSDSLHFLSKKTDYVVEGHLACEFNVPSDVLVVLRCNPFVLEKRLRLRGYANHKLKENVLAEILDYCTQRSEKAYKLTPLEIDTSKRSATETVKVIANAIKKKKTKVDQVNYSLSNWLGLEAK